jgi:hypothetical protein
MSRIKLRVLKDVFGKLFANKGYIAEKLQKLLLLIQ